ncbi:hypothetical protein Afe04nite_24360 [Asanoa ferruginea]|nr:hypothetical protein Afe04nite_24360 [Asanoa ferruginea]
MEVEKHRLHGVAALVGRAVGRTWTGRLHMFWQWHAEDLTYDLPGGSRTAYRVGAARTP